MSKVIDAVFEDGVFKPLKKIKFPEHKKVKIKLEDKAEPIAEGKRSLASIIDIANDCSDRDLSVHHDKFLYGEATD